MQIHIPSHHSDTIPQCHGCHKVTHGLATVQWRHHAVVQVLVSCINSRLLLEIAPLPTLSATCMHACRLSFKPEAIHPFVVSFTRLPLTLL
eukprot:scaffold46593_cov21-Tisochrysis_lutea.AAC.1